MNGVHKDSRVIRLLMAGALVLFVAACSSGGVKNDRDMYRDQAEALAEQLAMVNEQIAMVTGDLDEVSSDLEEAEARLESLDANVARLDKRIADVTAERDQYKTALDALESSGRQEDLDMIRQLMADIEAANDRIAGLQSDHATLTGERDALMEVVEGDGTADNPGLRKMVSDYEAAKARLEADRDEAARMAAEELHRRNLGKLEVAIRGTNGGNHKGADLGSLALTHDGAGMVTFSVGTFGDDGVATASVGSNGWTSAMLSRDDDMGERTMLVVTNIEAPGPAMFNTVYDATTRGMVLAGTTDADIARRSVAMAEAFPTEPGVTRMYGGTSENPATFRGTLHGVAGTYLCTAEPCSVTWDRDGVMMDSPNWTFTADNGAEMIIIPDPGYVYYGWWLKTGDGLWDFEVFRVGNPSSLSGVDITGVDGIASYEGTAYGKYGIKTYESAVHTDTAAGDFTADASLSANFSQNTIEGSITGFVLDGAESAPWSVALRSATIGGSGTSAQTRVNYGAGESGDVGNWGVGFFEPNDVGVPETLAGTFDAVTISAVLRGAFGASRVGE